MTRRRAARWRREGELLAFPDDLGRASGVPVYDAVGVRTVANVEVNAAINEATQGEWPLRKAGGLVALHQRDRCAVDGPSNEVPNVRSRVTAHTFGRDLGVPHSVVVAAGLQVAHG